jgi:hypothetical protein
MALFVNLAGVVLFKIEMEKAGIPRRIKEQRLSQSIPKLRTRTFSLSLHYSPGFLSLTYTSSLKEQLALAQAIGAIGEFNQRFLCLQSSGCICCFIQLFAQIL